MRNGVPVAALQNNANYQKAVADVYGKKAEALRSYTNHYTVTKQLSPKVSTVEGKLQGGHGAGAAGKTVANLDAADIEALTKETPSVRAVDTAKREASGDPSLLARGAGLIKGEEPDYKVGLNDQDRNHSDLVSRVLIPIAKLQNHSTRKPSKEELTAAAEAVIPNASDTPEGKARKIANLKRIAAMPGVLSGGGTPTQDVTTPRAAPSSSGGLITIKNKRTGETKQVTRSEAQALGAI
jgi:hypothetical protein